MINHQPAKECSDPEESGKNWFALYTKPRHEFKVEANLNILSIENYLPTIIVTKKWSDRKKKIRQPLFNGYIFIYSNEKERLLSLQQPAVVKTVCFQGKPAVIPNWEIENLKKLLEKSPEIFVTDKIEIGSRVRIVDGPFKDVEGIVTEAANNEKMLAVTMELLNRSVLVKLPAQSVIKFV